MFQSTRSRLAVCQMTSTEDRDENMSICSDLIRRAWKEQAVMVFLPEGFDFIASTKERALSLCEELHGKTISHYQELAKELSVWLSLGGFHRKIDNGMYNAHVLIDCHGDIVQVYHKVHLFDVPKMKLEESAYVTRGGEIPAPVETPVGKVGLQCCYDLRFPEMSLVQRQLGAQVLTFPSAFTVATGGAHWRPLLRARAIETQCYVIAAAQVGKHNDKRSSYGHAMVVDPWGAVVAECSDGNNICTAEVDLKYVENIRETMPVFEQRRYDLYRNPLL